MEFIYGFLFGWFVLGCFAFLGLSRGWEVRSTGFWVLLTLPAIPLVWFVVTIRDRFR